MEKSFHNAHEEMTEFVNPYKEEYLSILNFDFESCEIECTACEELKSNYHLAETEKEKFIQESLDEGMELFHKHFRTLWD